MSDGVIFAIVAICIAILMGIVGFIGNKIVDKSTDAIRNKAVHKKNLEQPDKPENLADRFDKGRKL